MFINENVSQSDASKFQLDELWNQYNHTNGAYEHHWTIDKSTGNWLLPVKELSDSEVIWIFHYRDTNIEIKLYKSDDGWDLLSIEDNPYNNQVVISTLRDALKVLADTSIKSPKERAVKQPKKKSVEKATESERTSKRKVPYFNILTSAAGLVILFYIANDKKISSIIKNDNNRTSQKTATVQSKYNLCLVEYNGIYLSNTKDISNQTKVVDIFNKQTMACNVDKYGALYWVNRVNDPGLFKANLDGTNSRRIMALPILAAGLAIDNKREKIYSAQWNTQRKHHDIVSSDFNGNNKTILFSNRALLRSVEGLFYNDADDKLYISDGTNHQIVTLNLNTKELQKVVSSNRPAGIVVDNVNHRVIWADNDVYSANLDGSDKKIIIPANGEKKILATVSIDTTNNHLLFGYLRLQTDANNAQHNQFILEITDLDGREIEKTNQNSLDSFSFFNNQFIVSKKNEMKQKKIIAKSNNLTIIPKLKSCLACHGQNWSRAALGKSKIVRNMSQKDIYQALKGYKNGTYGGPMKGVMKGQVVRYSDTELEQISQAITAWQ
ncbi:hypothetical protein [Sulfurimonas paralvinellae]|nr:hypothetical protein [Sulfurimonas paralvinellae]